VTHPLLYWSMRRAVSLP